MAGNTTSFDLPVFNAWQPANRGTELMVSPDNGVTWQPLGNLPPATSPFIPQAPLVTASSLDPKTVYAAREATIYRSTDGGVTFKGTAFTLAQGDAINTIAVTPDTVYVSSANAIFKSYDTGLTWSRALAPGCRMNSIVIDPFDARNIWAWCPSGGVVSHDAANSWMPSTARLPANVGISGGLRFVFDPANQGVIYGPGYFQDSTSSRIVFQKSTDGGATWAPVIAPFPGSAIAAQNGFVFAANDSTFYLSPDGGATWQSFPLPGPLNAIPTVDPANPSVILCGAYRSQDGGQTWSEMTPSRLVQASFAVAPSSTVYGAAVSSSDIFIAKFASDGSTPLLATYFGGMGNETAASVKADAAGNIWVFGTTTSTDLPVTADALQRTLTGPTNLFLARFDWTGTLAYCTYLGSTGTDTAAGMAISPDGSVWITGALAQQGFVTRLDPSGSQILFSRSLSGQPVAITVDPFGSAIVTGQISSGRTPYAFVTKFHAAGDVVFSKAVGGVTPIPANSPDAFQQKGTDVATDAAGNVYITGSTPMIDFPVSANAYQTSLHGGCAYPAFNTSTGFFSIIYYYYDDVFLVKLSPDGSSVLYSTYLGGSCYDRATGLAVTPDGVVFITGETDSQDFPAANSSEPPPDAQQYKSFVTALDTNSSALIYSSYLLAGANPKVAMSLDGAVFVAGDQGLLAQTQTYTSPYNPQLPAIHAVLIEVNR
jgi:photosystem II stability/assembly factor-like uncharacterized protein